MPITELISKVMFNVIIMIIMTMIVSLKKNKMMVVID